MGSAQRVKRSGGFNSLPTLDTAADPAGREAQVFPFAGRYAAMGAIPLCQAQAPEDTFAVAAWNPLAILDLLAVGLVIKGPRQIENTICCHGRAPSLVGLFRTSRVP